MLKAIFKKVTYKFGFSIKRVKPKKKYNFDFGKPLYIEFVGVPGVGKTTLFEKINFERQKWLLLKDFVQLNKNKLNDEIADSLDFYKKIADYKITSVTDKSFNPIDKLRVFHFYYTTITKDILVTLFNKKYVIVSDEGLFHNFGDSLIYLHTSDKESFNKLIKNRAIIYCYSTPEIIANQVIKRKEKTGKLVPQHKVNSFEELIEKQKKSLKNKEQFINVLKENQVPVLMINTSDDIGDNVKKVNTFISNIQKKN